MSATRLCRNGLPQGHEQGTLSILLILMGLFGRNAAELRPRRAPKPRGRHGKPVFQAGKLLSANMSALLLKAANGCISAKGHQRNARTQRSGAVAQPADRSGAFARSQKRTSASADAGASCPRASTPAFSVTAAVPRRARSPPLPLPRLIRRNRYIPFADIRPDSSLPQGALLHRSAYRC